MRNYLELIPTVCLLTRVQWHHMFNDVCWHNYLMKYYLKQAKSLFNHLNNFRPLDIDKRASFFFTDSSNSCQTNIWNKCSLRKNNQKTCYFYYQWLTAHFLVKRPLVQINFLKVISYFRWGTLGNMIQWKTCPRFRWQEQVKTFKSTIMVIFLIP